MHQNIYIKLKKDYAEKFSKSTSIEIQSQHRGENRQFSIGIIAVEIFPSSFDPGNNEEKYEFHSYISDDTEQDACGSHAYMLHLLKTWLESGILVSGMSTVWEYTNG